MPKKLFIMVMIAFVVSNVYPQEQKHLETILVEIGEYKAGDKMFVAEAYVSKDSSMVYLYRLPATHTSPSTFYYDYKPKVYIECTPTMKDELLKIAAKYREWTDVAINNSVGKTQKVIEMEFPIVKLSLHGKNKEDRILDFKNRKFTFSIYNPQKTPSIFCNDSFKTLFDINVYTGLVFISPDEFDAFVDFLDPEKVRQRLKEGKTSLFSQDEPAGKTSSTSSTTNAIIPTSPQKKTDSNRSVKRVDKGKIARGALERWKNAAKKGSGIQ